VPKLPPLQAVCLLSALLALAPPCSAGSSPAPPASPADAYLDQTQSELMRLMDELTPLLQRLAALREDYPDRKGFKEYSAQRRALREAIDPRLRRLAELRNDYSAAKERRALVALIGAAAPLFSGRGISPETAGNVALAAGRRRFSDQAHDFVSHAIAQLVVDDRAFDDLSAEEAGRRRWRAAGGACASALLLALLLGGWRWRRRMAERSRLAPGTVLQGNYRIEEELGRGPSGISYAARDLSLGRPLVIKRLSDEVCRKQAALDSFARRARSAALLHHPNVAEIYAYFEERGGFFLAMERVSGEPLERLLACGRAFSAAEAASFAERAAAALDYAHAQGVAHGSLGPSKFFLTPEGGLKVVDFAIGAGAGPQAAPAADVEAFAAVLETVLGPERMTLREALRKALPRGGRRPCRASELAAALKEGTTLRRPPP